MDAPLRLVPSSAAPPAPTAAPADRDLGWEPWVAIGIALAASILAFAATQSEARALARLAPAERAALLERTRANVASLCSGEAALQDRCREEVELLRLLPECDPACQAAALAAQPGPTR